MNKVTEQDDSPTSYPWIETFTSSQNKGQGKEKEISSVNRKISKHKSATRK